MSRNHHKVQPIERFPSVPRKDGRFQKRINGKLYYFGANGDRAGAIREYERVKHAIYDGATASRKIIPDDISIKQLAAMYLADKARQYDMGRIVDAHLRNTRRAIRRFVNRIGASSPWNDIGVEEFSSYALYLSKKVSPRSFNRERAAVLNMFNHASRQDWISHVPKFGVIFVRYAQGKLRENKPDRFIEPGEINAMIGIASMDIGGMILLGLNGGFGIADCAALPWSAVDIDGGLIKWARTKNNIPRAVPIWPETAFWLKRLRSKRPLSEFVFRTKYGNAWNATGVAHEMAKLIARAGLGGITFYCCRHTFATHANEIRDTDARRHIMGRKLPNLDDIYVEGMLIERLKKLTDHVRLRTQINEFFFDAGIADG